MATVTDTIANRPPIKRHYLEINSKLVEPMAVQREWLCAHCKAQVRYTASGYRCECGPVEVGTRLITRNAREHQETRERYEGEQIVLGQKFAGEDKMPIKGLTNRAARFPEIGHIRKGAMKTNEKRPGEDLTYFRVEFEDQEAETAATFHRAYGDEPQELNIMLAFDDLEHMWDAWREAYVAGGLVHRCDGEIVHYPPEERGQPCHLQHDPDQIKRCKPVGRLRVIVPELQRLAYLTVHTTSIHDIINISSQLDALLQLAGRLTGIPLVLRRRPKKISTPSGPNGKRARRVKWLLSIEADPSWVREKLTALKVDALPGNGVQLLPAGDEEHEPPAPAPGPAWFDEEDEEGDVIEAEYEEQPEPPAPAPEPRKANGDGNGKPTEPHWIDNEKVRKRFWAFTSELALTNHDVHAALGVESVRDFQGTMEEAKALIEAYGPPEYGDAEIDPDAPGVLDYFLMEPAALVAHAQTQGLVVTLEKGAVVVKNTVDADTDLVRALATRPDVAGVLKAEAE